METCRIQWIDEDGNPTPDQNPAIGRCRTLERDTWIDGRVVHNPASEWFPICREHAAHLWKLNGWTFEAYQAR